MMAKNLKISELNEPVRILLDQMQADDIVTLEDEQGRARFIIAPVVRASPAERAAALSRLRHLQEETRQSMQGQGVSEEDVDRLLQEDDRQ